MFSNMTYISSLIEFLIIVVIIYTKAMKIDNYSHI